MAQYVALQLSEVAVPYRLYRMILDRTCRIVTILLRAALTCPSAGGDNPQKCVLNAHLVSIVRRLLCEGAVYA